MREPNKKNNLKFSANVSLDVGVRAGSGSGQPSRRQLQVAEVVRVALSRELISFPLVQKNKTGEKNLAHFKTEVSITISEVQMSRDLRHARVFFMPLLKDSVTPRALADILNSEAPFLQDALRSACALRFVPRLRFVVDTAFEKASSIHQTLVKVRAKDSAPL